MFVQNKTSFKVRLTRGRLVDKRSIGTIVIQVAYQYARGALVPSESLPDARPTDPPDTTGDALWHGTSVTAAGNIQPSRSEPAHIAVTFAVGLVVRRLIAFGDRRWIRDRSGSLRASAPERFDPIPMSFAHAFGGYFDVAPGLFPETDLPFAGGRIGYSLNESGIGFYRDDRSAEGRPLPNLELADQLIQQWNDRPTPGCFVPCSDLAGLRSFPPGEQELDPSSPKVLLAGALRGLHHAPGYLVFDELAPRTPIALDALGPEAIRFEVPPAPVRVRVRYDVGTTDARAKLRSVHVDADQAIVRCVWGHSFLYEDGEAPSWILVEN